MKFFVAVAVVLTVLTGCSAVVPDIEAAPTVEQDTDEQDTEEQPLSDEEVGWLLFKNSWDTYLTDEDREITCEGWNGSLSLQTELLDAFMSDPIVREKINRGHAWKFFERVCP